MSYVVKINAADPSDIEGYFTGKIHQYQAESVAIPGIAQEKTDPNVKVYKHHKNAKNAVIRILNKSSYVSMCEIEDY